MQILGIVGPDGGHLVKQAGSPGFRRNRRAGLKLFGTDFHGDHGMGDEVVIPVGIGGVPALGSGYHETIAIHRVDQWIDARLLTLGPCGVCSRSTGTPAK